MTAPIFGRRRGQPTQQQVRCLATCGRARRTPTPPDTVADLFTRGPDAVVPGTTMPVQRVEEPADLAALLRFLEAATR